MKIFSFRTLAWTAACVVGLLAIPAVADDGSLSPQELATLRSSFRMDDHTRAMYNAITSIDISQLTLNRDIVRKHNDLFSNKIKTSTVTNQFASGRCWLFAGLNVLRPDLVVKHKLGKFELSQSYLAFWDKMEKANCFLEDMHRSGRSRHARPRRANGPHAGRRGRRLVGVCYRPDQEVWRGSPGNHAGNP